MVIIKWPDAGIGRHHIGRRHRAGIILARAVAEILDLVLRDFHRVAIGFVRNIGRADQGEFAALIGNCEHDAPITVLKEIGMVAFMPARHDDVAAFHKAQMRFSLLSGVEAENVVNPCAGGIHDRLE